MKRMIDNEKIQTNENGVNVSGDLHVDSKISGGEIVEDMAGYSVSMLTPTGYTLTPIYVGAVKNGNKLTIVIALNITKSSGATSQIHLCDFTMPTEVMDKIYPSSITNDYVNKPVYAFASVTNNSLTFAYAGKTGGKLRISGYFPSLTADLPYYWRLEATFLLSENLASSN